MVMKFNQEDDEILMLDKEISFSNSLDQIEEEEENKE
jgi:hypothetical protein